MIFLAFSNPYKFSEIRRITPAYAGKRPGKTCFPGFPWDHPRLCGEKFDSWGALIWILGSPPPMRGKVLDRQIFPIICRITPAYAGKRIISVLEFFGMWDHPRLCGEKCGTMLMFSRYKGSPPPMRGKARVSTTVIRRVRITPAYAGKRIIIFVDTGYQRDHPRLCGEKERASEYIDMVTGSPPPMRGKGEEFAKAEGIRRITPAYAGKSS